MNSLLEPIHMDNVRCVVLKWLSIMCSARLCAGQKVLPEMRRCLGTPVRLTAKYSSVHPCKSFAPAALLMTNACAATAPVHIKQAKCLLCIQGTMQICTIHAVMSEVNRAG